MLARSAAIAGAVAAADRTRTAEPVALAVSQQYDAEDTTPITGPEDERPQGLIG